MMMQKMKKKDTMTHEPTRNFFSSRFQQSVTARSKNTNMHGRGGIAQVKKGYISFIKRASLESGSADRPALPQA
jgi:hypothetical protein